MLSVVNHKYVITCELYWLDNVLYITSSRPSIPTAKNIQFRLKTPSSHDVFTEYVIKHSPDDRTDGNCHWFDVDVYITSDICGSHLLNQSPMIIGGHGSTRLIKLLKRV